MLVWNMILFRFNFAIYLFIFIFFKEFCNLLLGLTAKTLFIFLYEVCLLDFYLQLV